MTIFYLLSAILYCQNCHPGERAHYHFTEPYISVCQGARNINMLTTTSLKHALVSVKGLGI